MDNRACTFVKRRRKTHDVFTKSCFLVHSDAPVFVLYLSSSKPVPHWRGFAVHRRLYRSVSLLFGSILLYNVEELDLEKC